MRAPRSDKQLAAASRRGDLLVGSRNVHLAFSTSWQHAKACPPLAGRICDLSLRLAVSRLEGGVSGPASVSLSHLLTASRYVERNAARAGLEGPRGRAEDWRWSSLWRWRFGDAEATEMLSPWPVPASRVRDPDRSNRARQWLPTVNTPMNERELEALRTEAQRGRPCGSTAWVERMTCPRGLGAFRSRRSRGGTGTRTTYLH